MDELKRIGDYEYGYDHLYEQKKPADTVEDAEGMEDIEGLADGEEQDETEFEIDQDDYGDDEPYDTSDMESVLAVERIMREINVKPLDLDIPTEDTHGMLKRDMKAESLRRFEEAARSLKDFNDVISTWDKLDQNRERRERYNEVLREERTIEYGRRGDGLIFPQWMMDATYRQLSRGSFFDYLFDCPYEMHDLTGKAYLRKIVDGMKEDHKEIFFFLYLRQYSPQRLAVVRGQTDRNIRKVRDVILRKVRKKVYNELKRLNKYGYAMSDTERDFYQRYEETEGRAK